tara:strand:- start:46 stop:405 length:360 start_codon:yes stop_codon:yes gene_type:complete
MLLEKGGNIMKRLTYCIIIMISITLAFSANKPCCNKKAGKSKTSCKFNQASIEDNKDFKKELASESINGDQKSFKCNTANENSQCSTIKTKPWWKFWAKKSTNACPCKQAQANAEIKKS